MSERRHFEAIDACRPNSDDLRQPEMADLAEALQVDPRLGSNYQRSQEFDAIVVRMMPDLPVPDGLEERLLLALTTSQDADRESREAGEWFDDNCRAKGQAVQPRAAREHVPATARDGVGRRPRGRRWAWTLAAASLVAAGAVAAVLVLAPSFTAIEPRADEQLPREILAWVDAVVREGWNTDFEADRVRRRPLDLAVRATPRRWCSIRTRYDPQTAVYDVSSRDADFALAFCMDAPVRTSLLPEIPPWNPQPATGGLTVGVWRRGNLVYVLACRGGTRRYRELIEGTSLIG